MQQEIVTDFATWFNRIISYEIFLWNNWNHSENLTIKANPIEAMAELHSDIQFYFEHWFSKIKCEKNRQSTKNTRKSIATIQVKSSDEHFILRFSHFYLRNECDGFVWWQNVDVDTTRRSWVVLEYKKRAIFRLFNFSILLWFICDLYVILVGLSKWLTTHQK